MLRCLWWCGLYYVAQTTNILMDTPAKITLHFNGWLFYIGCILWFIPWLLLKLTNLIVDCMIGKRYNNKTVGMCVCT